MGKETDISKIRRTMFEGVKNEFPKDKLGNPYLWHSFRDGAWYGTRIYSAHGDEEEVFLRRASRQELIIQDCYEKIIALDIGHDSECGCSKGKRTGLFRSENNLLR